MRWLNASSPEGLQRDVLTALDALGEPGHERPVQTLCRWLQEHHGWLLVVDAVIDAASLARTLVVRDGGAVLVTSTEPNVEPLGILDPITIDSLEHDEAVDFLVRRGGVTRTEEVDKLVEELSRFPIALEQAGAYLRATRCSVREYLDAFLADAADTLKRSRPQLGRYNTTVTATVLATLKRLESASTGAAELANTLACLASAPFPADKLPALARLFRSPVPERVNDASSLARRELLALLVGYALLRYDSVRDTFTMHSLTATVIRSAMPREVLRKRWQRVSVGLKAILAVENRDPYYRQAALIPHLTQAADIGRRLRFELEIVQMLQGGVGILHERIGAFENAAASYALAREDAVRAYGKNSIQPAEMDRFAGTMWVNAGQVARGLELIERARTLAERLARKQRKRDGVLDASLADLLHELDVDELQAALKLGSASRVFARLRSEGKFADLSKFSDSYLETFGLLLAFAGSLDLAEQLLDTAVERRAAEYGKESDAYAMTLEQRVIVDYKRGDFATAVQRQRTILALRRKNCGDEHPSTALSLHNLGIALRDHGELDEAQRVLQEALSLRLKLLGPQNIYVGDTLASLAYLEIVCGKYDAAAEHLGKADAIDSITGVGSEKRRLRVALRRVIMQESGIDVLDGDSANEKVADAVESLRHSVQRCREAAREREAEAKSQLGA